VNRASADDPDVASEFGAIGIETGRIREFDYRLLQIFQERKRYCNSLALWQTCTLESLSQEARFERCRADSIPPPP
jgi:hypothetical protein